MFKFLKEWFRNKETLMVGVITFNYRRYATMRDGGHTDKTVSIFLYERDDGHRSKNYKYEGDELPQCYLTSTTHRLVNDWVDRKLVTRKIPSYASVKDGGPVAQLDNTDNLGVL